MLNKFPVPHYNYIYGTDQDDSLFGPASDDVMIGGGGSDTFMGGKGNDWYYGGTGDDHYYVQDAGDQVVEYANEGIDTVYSYLHDYTLGANVENLYLMNGAVTGTGNSLDNYLTGNDSNNILLGLDGNDMLNGGAGADVMVGGIGDDQYWVDNVGDIVWELAGPSQGHDSVTSSISYSLVGTNVEDLFLSQGAGSINGTGNDDDNSIVGNEGNNILKGGGGEDFIVGGGGKDTMSGGAGDDYIVVDSTDDVVVEFAGEGYDTLYTTANCSMPDNVEFMIMDGSQDMLGWGNGQDNSILGSSFNDHIYGLGGNDVISGRQGNDIITGGAGDDTMTGGSGKDTFRFQAGFGHDTLMDFRANGDDDVIEFDHNLFANFNAVHDHMTQNGSDTVITLDADNSITLHGVNMGQLTDLQFHFV